ncbi:glycosyltransferase [uncultured Methanobrevibacter sp.]|uniref:glycosyltransferase n=1 Tax=uncultured Methanobrevibacter sp. TaxID=253161 RepID=UPI0025F61699|nr:glycosyltransferase [uncultured Methanobrevibacter sp.]
MNFMEYDENYHFKGNDKNIALIINKYENGEFYEGVFIFKLFEKFNENLSTDIDNSKHNFLNSLNIFVIDENNINNFKTQLSSNDLIFDLIIFHHSLFDSEFFDLNLLKLIINASNENNIKTIFDIDDNLDLLDSFYDDSNLYLLRTLVQKTDLIITSNDTLKSELIDFNISIIVMPKLPSPPDSQIFIKLVEKWIILFESLLRNDLILDVIIQYLTEIAEYKIIHNNSTNDYKISVVIPIHNTGKKLWRTLKSIENQTFGIKYIEVLMVNDCSTDKVTLDILNEFVKKDNFKLIDLKDNQGRPGIPRNVGIKESSADYIMFLDHDDFLEISALEKLYNELVSEENKELDLVFGTYATVVNEKSTIYFDDKDKDGYVSDLTESPRLITFPAPSIWTKLFKKDVIIKNNILFPHILGEDAVFLDKFLLKAKGIKYLQRSLIAFHDLGDQSITNNVTLRYLREGVYSEYYLKKYFEMENVLDYFKYRVNILANFHLKKYVNQSKLTEKEMRLIFPKYVWAMKQVESYGSDLLASKESYDIILTNNVERLIEIRLPNTNKQNVLYITVLDETKSFPLIDSLDKLLNDVNVYAITYTDFKIKLWSCNLDNFTLLREIKFNDRIPNFYQLNNFYEDIFDNFKIDKVFFRHFGSNQIMFYYRSMIQTQKITPISFASDRNIVTIYGENSKNLLDNLDFNYLSSVNLNPKHEKGVVYTAIFGDYEDLLDPKVINEDLDYVCFTDNPNLKSDIWNIKLIPDYADDFNKFNNKFSFEDLDYTRRARTIKMLPHVFLKEYDFSIWVDAGFLIVGDVINFINRYTKKDFLGVAHSIRHCLYDEADEVLRLEMDDEELIKKQIKRYENDNYPRNNGLIESGILFRRHGKEEIKKVMEDWFNEIINYSKRDQISFNYVAWKNNLDFDLANLYSTRNPYFHHYFHKAKTINNKATLKEFRVILLDNGDLKAMESSINEINKINDYIPISILTINKYIHNELRCDFYNLEIIYENDISLEGINEIISKKSEKFIHVMKAGEILDYEFVLGNI